MSFVRVFVAAATALVLVSCAQAPTVPPPRAPAPPPTAAPVPPAATPPPTAAPVPRAAAPTPLTQTGQPVVWWFVFKFNAKSFPQCGPAATTVCPFGGTVASYSEYSRQYVYASSVNPSLQTGIGCIGETVSDPVGATFDEIYNQPFHYVVWNDQFYQTPKIQGCGDSCDAPWGHSKGTLVWNDAGDGMVLQVTTPSWPAAASSNNPRMGDGNTLGCVKDNNLLVSQHFFALKLNKDDVIKMLIALQNASVVTDPTNPELVNNGGPTDIQALVSGLGVRSTSKAFTKETLSCGVVLVSKPSNLHVPPWQFISALLGQVSLRTATWWATPKIYTTTSGKKIDCWDSSLGESGRVEIATTGQWSGTEFGLAGGPGADFNHAKIGVSISNAKHLVIFGDMNQQGAITGNCASSQNGRGGLFFVVEDQQLAVSVTALIDGDTAPTKAP